MKITSLSKEIFLSRDAIRVQISNEIKNYMDIVDVKLTKSSFLSFIINIISTLTSNILFYQISVYKEFFLTKAQISSSVINSAASIGYMPYNAEHANLDLLLTFPFRFEAPEITFKILPDTEFKVDKKVFYSIDYTIKCIVTANTTVRCYKYNNDINEEIFPMINTDLNTFSIILSTKQIKKITFEFSSKSNEVEYKFTQYYMNFEGQMSDIEVLVEDPLSGTIIKYQRYSSIYLLDSETYGFVVRKHDTGYNLLFGNGLIGKVPQDGSIIRATVFTTLGSDGSVVKDMSVESTKTRIVGITDSGKTEYIKYDISNPVGSIGGMNEPNLEEIKYLAIDNLTSLHRLVSENDYHNVGSLLNNVPMTKHTYPVLKRSDIRNNEIQIFTLLEYMQNIVPTENIHMQYPLDTADVDGKISIEKYQTFNYNGIEYITPFLLEVDTDLEITKYIYVTSHLKCDLLLISTTVIAEDYSFYGNYLTVETINNKTILKIFFQTEEIDYIKVSCSIRILNTLIDLPMTIDTVNNCFSIEFDPYTVLPEGNNTYYFDFEHEDLGKLNEYSSIFVCRRKLDHTMLSNTVIDSNLNTVTIHDIPVIKKSYYDNITNKFDFEYAVIQRLVEKYDFVDVRMITDFVNIKFANTSVKLKNMLLNKETRLPIDFIELNSFEHAPITGERFIINGTELPEWNDKKGYIAIYNGPTASKEWTYVKPEMDDIIYAKNTQKKYIFTSCEWIEPIFEIPLLLSMDIKMQDNFSIDQQQFIQSIKTAIINDYSDRMVCQSYLNRSEIVATIQNVAGVDHCRIIQPISNIFYNFELTDLTTDELLNYTPELMFFTEENISIRLVQ